MNDPGADQLLETANVLLTIAPPGSASGPMATALGIAAWSAWEGRQAWRGDGCC